MGAIHQPPPVHQTFEGPNLVVCSFVPRPFDFYPGAIKVPYHHANVDSDEVLFYSAGNFMSRSNSGIGVGRSPCTRRGSSTVLNPAASSGRSTPTAPKNSP